MLQICPRVSSRTKPFIMKSQKPKQVLTQDERSRVDRAVNRQILVPKYRRTEKNKQRLLI